MDTTTRIADRLVSDNLGQAVSIRAEEAADGAAISHLHDVAFGPGRYARTAFRLRENARDCTELASVAMLDGRLLGSVRLSHIRIGEEPALLLGPLAVMPDVKNRGVGKVLVAHALKQARVLGHKGVLLVGDQPYYGPLGFVCVGMAVQLPGPAAPERVLLADLSDGMIQWQGMVRPD